jgi:poly(hydroxyalkanoate) depolymerase family esterase
MPAPLLVVLHGCTQSATDLAAETRLNALADRRGLVVAYPEQAASRNARRCWNWFDPAHQERGAGEPALLAAAVERMGGGVGGQAIDPARVLLAGFSAGGAMACVLAAAYPELFAALAVHSGLAYRTAAGLPAALRAMRCGASDPASSCAAASAAMVERARALPTIVLHGTADHIVNPVNGDQVARQWLHANGLDGGLGSATTVHGRVEGAHAYVRRRWSDRKGRLLVEQVTVDGLGHAWSGGADGGAYADPRGPSAADALWRFFEEAGALAT